MNVCSKFWLIDGERFAEPLSRRLVDLAGSPRRSRQSSRCRSLRCAVKNVWRDSRSSNCSIAIMLTAPMRSIFARRSATISSGVITGGDADDAERPFLLPSRDSLTLLDFRPAPAASSNGRGSPGFLPLESATGGDVIKRRLH